MQTKFTPIQYVEDDGLPIMDVGNWAQKKYKLVGRYCDIFTKGMRNQWNLVYIDFFSGSGYAKNRQSGQIMKNAGMIALSLPYQFDYYIFNDYLKESSDALEKRITREHSNVKFKVHNKDANIDVHEIIKSIPKFNNRKGTLIFCFIDPFSLNLNFNTIKILAQYQVDILILHALQMDGKRNFKYYIKDNNERIEAFTGNSNWRAKFMERGFASSDFVKFISDEFDLNMKSLNYKPCKKKEEIKNTNGTGIYYLAFYSKHERGIDFFEKVQKGDNNQFELF